MSPSAHLGLRAAVLCCLLVAGACLDRPDPTAPWLPASAGPSLDEALAYGHTITESGSTETVLLDFEGAYTEADIESSLYDKYASLGVTIENVFVYDYAEVDSAVLPPYYWPRSGVVQLWGFHPDEGYGIPTIRFARPVLSVGVYVRAYDPVTLTCHTNDGVEVGSAHAHFSWDSFPVLPPAVFIEVTGGGISSCSAPVTVSIDDLSFVRERSASIRVADVQTQLPDGSFTTAVGENRIRLRAEVSDPALASTVRWEVVDDPEDRTNSGDPIDPPNGIETTLVVNSPGAARWSAFAHPGALDQKALRFRVRASVEVGRTRVFSEPVVVRQHPLDAIRQEHLDFPGARVPGRTEFVAGAPTFAGMYAGTGLGDYCAGADGCLTLVSPRLSELVGWVETRWKQPLQVNSIYRNPVHHHVHGPSTNDSPHKYGTAIDYQAIGTGRAQRLYWAALRNVGLAYPGGVCAEPFSLSPTHVHFDRRDAQQNVCPASWKTREAPSRGRWGLPSFSRSGTGSEAVAALASDDPGVRAEAVSDLLRLTDAEMPAGYADAAIALLGREVAQPAADVDGGYLLDLILLVTRTDLRAAVPFLARLGVEASAGARQLVARHPDLALPALDAAWGEEARRADVLATYGEMLVLERAGLLSLTSGQRGAIDQRFVAAASSGPVAQWGLAFVVGSLELSEWTPLVERMATSGATADDPLGLVRSTAADVLPELRADVGTEPVSVLSTRLRRLQESVCVGAQGSRRLQCITLASVLFAADRAIARGQLRTAREILVGYRSLLEWAVGRQLVSATEYDLLVGNATPLIARLT